MSQNLRQASDIMRKQSEITCRKVSVEEVDQDDKRSSQPLTDRDKHIMSKIRKLRPLGCRTSLKKMKAFLEEDRGKPHCKVIEDLMLNSFCKGYCKEFLEACRKVFDAEIYIVAKKVLKIGFLPLSEIASILKLKKAQLIMLQNECEVKREGYKE